jgi:adenine-specific DNA-methyltransferase
MNLVKTVYDNTMIYLDTVSKTDRKKIGQFFTPAPIAEYMGSLSRNHQTSTDILDPGAGSGILSAAIVESLIKKDVQHISLDAYENNTDILPLLKRNLCFIQDEAKEQGIVFEYRIIEENFIEANRFAWTGLIPSEKYDVVIANPPYKKIGKNTTEAAIMRDIVYGQPNLYFLFMAMGAQLLKNGGECIYIVPRSFSSGLYFTAFRNRFLSMVGITDLHLFTSRETIGGAKDSVLQETIIMRATKASERPHMIEISESSGENCNHFSSKYSVEYNLCVKSDKNAFMFFPSCEEDARTLDFVNAWPSTLMEHGYKMRTGIVVDFRETEWMRTNEEDDVVPLLWAYNFHNHRIKFPVECGGKPQFLLNCSEAQRLYMKKDNYLLLKRFTSKEEKKRLQCALLLEEDFVGFDRISTENHLNFITKTTGKMSKEELYGLFVILNSERVDKYFRILNGSTQVNANEINPMPFPPYQDIVQMGRKIMAYTDLTKVDCDAILDEQFSQSEIYKAI